MDDDRFVILTEYFRSDRHDRQREIIKSIEVNARIPQTKRIVLFMDAETEFPEELKRALSKENFNKIEVHELTPAEEAHTPTFCRMPTSI